jgi:diguanylate cyclase (GGDEF)-like protein
MKPVANEQQAQAGAEATQAGAVHTSAEAGTDAAQTGAGAVRAGADAVLSGVRRLAALADTAQDGESVFAALARELTATVGAEEIHVHHLSLFEGQELVVVYMLGGDGRISYLQPREERPPGVSWVASTGRSFLAVGPRELTASVPRLTFTCPPSEGSVACALLVPLTLAGQVEAVVVLVRRSGDPFTERAIEDTVTLVDQASTGAALVRARAEAGTDAVAGCMNHRAMRRRLREEIGRARRSGTPLSCLMIDLDDFKLVNDRHGHHAGDTVLRGVAQALMGEFRAFDRVARYGGDEFVVILPFADIQSASAAATRALAHLSDLQLPGSSTIGVSASIGAAQWREPMGVDELLVACDAALLERKRHGKAGVSAAGLRPGVEPLSTL